MKVYVDEMPNSCHNCCFECNSFCCINSSYVIDNYFQDTKHKDCPLKSLDDYTKQVRKEMAEQIMGKVKQLIDSKDFKLCNYEYANGYCYALQYKLPQILGKIGEEEC